MKTISRIVIICFVTFAVGFLYNQLYKDGIKRQLLFSPSFLKQSKSQNLVKIIIADSAFVLWNGGQTDFIDIRSRDDFHLDHITGAKCIPLNELLIGGKLPKLEKNRLLVIYDQEGDLDNLKIATNEILKEKLRTVYILFGGYLSWLEGDYPIEGDENKKNK